MKHGRKRAERQFLCSTPNEVLDCLPAKKESYGLHFESLNKPISIVLRDEEHHHLSLALRLKVGDEVSLLDKLLNLKYQGIIKSITKDKTEIEAASYSYLVKSKITAIVGISDQKVLDLLVEKLTELGVDHISLYKAEFSNAQNTNKSVRIDRLEKIRDSALKQSGSYADTQVTLSTDLLTAISGIDPSVLKICLLPPNDNDWTPLNHLLTQNGNVTEIKFVVGPEGGLSDKEVSLLSEQGFYQAGLCENTLRVETACIVTAGIILQNLTRFSHDR